MRVLIAEDDSMTRLLLDSAVRKLGHETVLAHDGHQAWALFQAGGIDIIVSDWVMPEMDGVALCRSVRARDAASSCYTYFLVLTGLSERERFLTAMEHGADDYLIKPLDPIDLQARLAVATRVMGLYQQLQRTNAQLFEQARQDALTRLGNRLRLHEDLHSLNERVARYDHSYAVLMCDVDYFKRYNDHYGHLMGDKVLCRVSETIDAQRRGGDTAYRYGGEEFVLILPEQGMKAAHVVAERVRWEIEALSIPHEARPLPAVITISIGVAAASAEHARGADEVLKTADHALYRAKEHGRNRVVSI